MKAKYDTEELSVTGRFQNALHELIYAQLEMMKKHEPELADCWTWGICRVGDLAHVNGLSFEFGGDDCKPESMGDYKSMVIVGDAP